MKNEDEYPVQFDWKQYSVSIVVPNPSPEVRATLLKWQKEEEDRLERWRKKMEKAIWENAEDETP